MAAEVPPRQPVRTPDDLDRDGLRELLRVYAANWLAHDGCWFLGIEEEAGHKTARRYNNRAWERFAPAEARRLLRFLGRGPGEGLDALAETLAFRLYARINRQEILRAKGWHAEQGELPGQLGHFLRGHPEDARRLVDGEVPALHAGHREQGENPGGIGLAHGAPRCRATRPAHQHCQAEASSAGASMRTRGAQAIASSQIAPVSVTTRRTVSPSRRPCWRPMSAGEPSTVSTW